MTDTNAVRAWLKTMRPRLSDDFVSDGIPFDYDITELGFRLQGTQFSIYDEEMDAVLLRSKKYGPVLANNTYLASFAYNTAIVWSAYGHEYARLARGEECALAGLMRYNLKKFFAEQILYRTSNVFGRAILLETLLYEERAMRPLFAAAPTDPVRTARYEYFAHLMSTILLFHEIGHLIQDERPDFEALLIDEIGESGGSPFVPAWTAAEELGRVEFRCDAYAVATARKQAPAELPAEFVLRAIAFAFAIFACMTGLEKSAAETAGRYPGGAEPDLLDEYRKDLPGAGFCMGRDRGSIIRANSAAAVCLWLAEADGIDLTSGTDFPFHPDMIDGLAEFATKIIDVVAPDIRGLCELLARAFQGNPRGMRYLLLRSKRFRWPRKSLVA